MFLTARKRLAPPSASAARATKSSARRGWATSAADEAATTVRPSTDNAVRDLLAFPFTMCRSFQCDGGLGIFPSRIAACHANVAMTMADSFRSSSFMRSG